MLILLGILSTFSSKCLKQFIQGLPKCRWFPRVFSSDISTKVLPMIFFSEFCSQTFSKEFLLEFIIVPLLIILSSRLVKRNYLRVLLNSARKKNTKKYSTISQVIYPGNYESDYSKGSSNAFCRMIF